MWVDERGNTYIVPITFGELDSRGSPLDACTID